MDIVLCRCSWDLPGVKSLPPHQHYTYRLIRRTGDGREFAMTSHWIEQSGFEVVQEHVDIFIPINWKALSRVL